MKEGQRLWNRDELILAVNLYCKLPFGKMHSRTKEVIHLANLVNRTPSSIALKLVNFASFDPTLKERGIKGAANASKLDRQIWEEFYNNWDAALLESEKLLASKQHETIEQLNGIDEITITKEGLTKERLVNTRVNQAIFRKVILATYNNTCCITGINESRLLIASHIIPWSQDEKNRLNPMNGLCLNSLHDKAFDQGLITVDSKDYSISVSSLLKKIKVESMKEYFLNLEGRMINLPDKFLPSRELLRVHNDFFKP